MSSRSHGALRRVARSRTRIVVAVAMGLSLLAGVTAVAADATTPVTATTAPTGYTDTKTESFTTNSWWRSWNLPSLPWHTTMVTEGTNQFLRVNFPVGSHNGTSFEWLTGTADSAHIRYRIRLSGNWTSDGGKLPGFGNPTYNPDGTCSGGCGLAPADGITSWSARGHLNAKNVPGSYLYTPDRTEWAFQWNTAPLVPGRWYTIDYWVTMNTPGQDDGTLRAAVDGTTVLDWTTMNFRLVDSLHVGKAWFGFYYGGTSVPTENMWIDIDDITVDW